MIKVLVQRPGGTRENSPPIYRWEVSEQPVSPVGTTESEEGVIRPSGTRRYAAIIVPSTEDAGLLSEVPPGLVDTPLSLSQH